MTLLLRWREANRGDRAALQGFTCTTPAPKSPLRRRPLPHPKRWEREVEAGIRSQHPPIGDGSLQLGEDAAGLAAVALVHYLEAGRAAKLTAVAVACRCRGLGGRYADEALEMALRAAADYGHARGHPVVTASGLVAPENRASQAMNSRAGMRHLFTEDDGLQLWAIDLEVPPDLVQLHPV